MSAFDCYKTWNAVQAHFTRKTYDYFKYNGNVRASEKSFMARNDKYFFEKAARKFKRNDFVEYLVATYTSGQDTKWVGHVFSPKNEIAYLKWRKKIESLTYTFKEELDKVWEIDDNFNTMFLSVDGRHPLLYRAYSSGKVSLETLVVLDKLVGFTKKWEKYDDMMLNQCVELIRKYSPFFWSISGADPKKLRAVALEVFS